MVGPLATGVISSVQLRLRQREIKKEVEKPLDDLANTMISIFRKFTKADRSVSSLPSLGALYPS